MRIAPIGSIDKGGAFDGLDRYSLLQLDDSDIPPEGADDLELAGQLFEGLSMFDEGPGRPFCHSVNVVPQDAAERRYIGIAHVRWDV